MDLWTDKLITQYIIAFMCLSLWDESDGWFFGQITNNAMHYCALLRDLVERVRSWDENASRLGWVLCLN